MLKKYLLVKLHFKKIGLYEIIAVDVEYETDHAKIKILNTLSEKDYSKEEMSEADFINLVHCIIFATKEHAKEVIEKIVKIFVSCEKIQDKHQMDLFLALKIMIKYRYDDENDTRRLLSMITQSVSEKQLDQVLGYEELVQKNNDSEIKLAQKDHELAEKDKIITQMKEENEKLRKANERIINNK